MEQLEKLFTVEDIAEMTSLTTRTIRNYLKDGILKGKKIGGQWRFTREDIKNLMDRDAVAKNIHSEKKQAVLDFLDGVNTDIAGETQICAIADMYCDQASALKTRDRLTEIINGSGNDFPFLKFSWEYDEKEEKARVVLFGTPEFIIRAMEILK